VVNPGTEVYESVKPPSGNGKLLWHALGAKTVELINENVHVESVRDDVETLVMDAQVLEEILENADPAKKGKEIEIKTSTRHDTIRPISNFRRNRLGSASATAKSCSRVYRCRIFFRRSRQNSTGRTRS
jgi:hypothetical protein